ncbi:MAG: hypothetical protein ACXVZO_00165 [Gaiellaceae bacterium]
MRNRSRLLLVAVSLLVPLVVAVAAMGSRMGVGHEEGGATILSTTLAPSVPTDPTFHGVAPGGVPWVLEHGDARLRADGRLNVEIEGLVIPSLGTAGPVTSVSASLYCGADAMTAAAATTVAVPLSQHGDAEISTRISLPSSCLAPILVVNPNGGATRYIAVSGWKS